MRAAGSLLMVMVMATTALGQPAPPPPAAPPAPPAAGWYRLTLNDGRVVDGQLVGGDAVNYFVQTPGGVFSIARASVIATTPLGVPAYVPPAPAPILAPTPIATPVEPAHAGPTKFQIGVGGLIAVYGTCSLIAYARLDADPDARAGFIPIAGPILWAATDDDEFGKDGWDWLALGASFLQAGALYGMLDALGSDKPKPPASKIVSVTSTRSFSGVILGGTF